MSHVGGENGWGPLQPHRVPKGSLSAVDFKTGRGIAKFDIKGSSISVPKYFEVDSSGHPEARLINEDDHMALPMTRLTLTDDSDRWAKYMVVHDQNPVSENVRVLLDIQEYADDAMLNGGPRVVRGVKYQIETKFQAIVDKKRCKLYLCTTRQNAEQAAHRIEGGKLWKLGTRKWDLSKLRNTGRLDNMIQAWASTLDSDVKILSMHGQQVDLSKTIKWKQLTSVNAYLSIGGVARHVQINEDRRIRTAEHALSIQDLIRLAEEFDRSL